jgi:cytochrome c oxidase subunit 2
MSNFDFSLINIFIGVASCDTAQPWQILFQDPASPVMEGIISLHHDAMLIIWVVIGLVMWMMGATCYYFRNSVHKNPTDVVHGTVLEIVWTVVPALILGVLAVPSFALLYSVEEVPDATMTIKAVGHQWYWTYEYSDYVNEEGESIAFDSYMIPEEDLSPGGLRLLEVDNRVVVPVNTHVRVIITAADVLHCWAVPSLGVKLDACPGRLNQTSFFANREGVYYGQCSESCGVNHGYMPICVEAVSLEDYVAWVAARLEGDDD